MLSSYIMQSWNKESILSTVRDEKVLFVRLQFIDILGMPKNIVIPVNLLESALDDDMQPSKNQIKLQNLISQVS